jgi:hypothetical protein
MRISQKWRIRKWAWFLGLWQSAIKRPCVDTFFGGKYHPSMDVSLLEDLISKNKPFRIETASGRVFDVPHRDFVSFSPRKTSLFIFYEEEGNEHFAIVPLLTVTAAMARA